MTMQHIYDRIISDKRYQQNLDIGEPRPGHPEGTVRLHIQELENNLELLKSKFNEDDYWKLKILIHVHDSLKPQAQEGVPITDKNSHASLAKQFLSEFCSDQDLLNMVQYHDEPYALWRQTQSKKGGYNESRLSTLLNTIQDWNLFAGFLIIDGSTIGKSREPLRWFVNLIQDQKNNILKESDIL